MVFDRSRALWGRSWSSWMLSVPLWAVLGHYRGLFGRSWVAMGASVGGLGQLPVFCGRSGVAIVASVDGLVLL